YPMIPITIGIIGARSAGRRSKGLQLSLLYVLGIALTYSILGTTAALTGSLFGGILQNVWVVVGVCLVFVVMALSLFGAFEIQVPANFATRMRGVHGSGAPGALLLGLVAGIVASPCIGPVLVAMLAFVAASGSVLLGFTLFFVFALGLGVLFVVLGTFTGLLAGIPKSGNWMLAVRYVFGLVFMGVALYYLHPFVPEGRGVLWVGVILLLGGVLLRGWRLVHETDPAPKRWLGALGRVVLVAGLYATILPLVRGESAAVTGPGWLGSEAHAAQKAQSEGKPLMVDFTADWCVACKELEHLTFSDPRVIELAKRFVTVRVDATKQTPEIQELMRKYGIVGLPWVAFVAPDGRILAALTVTGYIDADTMLARMQRALDGEATGS
ncbi:MAG TPA: cytochrome c biogenesis protein CcdA, partial [Candidatus Krumholzibacteria bacterium]|nr:cytochrome c biogenesis protein CcdA [Candidatus Krumholzibacteria bacterium]